MKTEDPQQLFFKSLFFFLIGNFGAMLLLMWEFV